MRASLPSLAAAFALTFRAHGERGAHLPESGLLLQVHQLEDGSPAVAHLASLSHHAKTVNCVRFSPNGAQHRLRCSVCLGFRRVTRHLEL